VPADITVRRADPAEADLVGELTERVYRDGGFGSGAYADVLRDGSRVRDGIVLVAAADGTITGTVTLALPGSPLAHMCRADEAEIRMLAVDEAARGHGVANRLMAACETLARDQGLAAMILCTETRMHAAQRLYERRGYLREPTRDWQISNVHLIAYRLPSNPTRHCAYPPSPRLAPRPARPRRLPPPPTRVTLR
jgi:ribosomal protein S18 acetylase RimI-like enzyme